MSSKNKKVETMTSRERVINVLNRKPVDRVPIDLGMNFSTGINGFAYANLREYLGLSTNKIELPNLRWFFARVDEDVLKRFHCDCLLLTPPYPDMKEWKYNEKFSFLIPSALKTVQAADGNWILSENPEKGGLYIDSATRENYTKGEYSKYFDPVSDIPSLAKRAEWIYKETDYATFMQGPGAFYVNHPEWLCKLALEPDVVKDELDAKADDVIKYVGRIIDSMGAYIQGYCVGSDLGTQRGAYVNPALYEYAVAPAVKKICTFIHRNSDMKVFFHSCGAIRRFIPILLDIGIDILNPVQISAADMDPEKLKEDFGNDLVFWGGGCDTQNVLGSGTNAKVRENVKKLMTIFKKNFGYVFNQVQDIVANVPPENIVTMFDTAYEEAFYSDEDEYENEDNTRGGLQ